MNNSGALRLAYATLCLGLLLAVGLSCGDGLKKIGGVESELFATPGGTITALAFAPDGRLFVTRQSGDVIIVTPDGEVLPEPFAQVDPATGQEWGLLGIAIDPEFEENRYVYIYFTQPVGSEPNQARPVLMRFTDASGEGQDSKVLIEFPMANPRVRGHVGGGLHFGPDGYLYLSIGETEMKELAQDLSSPFGKILRVTRDGEAAPSNPFVGDPGADPRVYAYGLRNPFAFTFDPETGRIYLADNGPSTCDELNIVEAGQSYGWPDSRSSDGSPCQNPGGVEPIYNYALPDKEPEDLPSNVAPTGLHFVSGEVYPTLGDGLLACEFNTKFMRRFQLAGPEKDQVIDDSVVVEDCTVAITGDGSGVIYYSNGQEVRRLVPE